MFAVETWPLIRDEIGIHIELGHKDEAIKLLEKAEQEHDHDIAYLRVFHVFDPLRPDPRFQALLRRVNFP